MSVHESAPATHFSPVRLKRMHVAGTRPSDPLEGTLAESKTCATAYKEDGGACETPNRVANPSAHR